MSNVSIRVEYADLKRAQEEARRLANEHQHIRQEKITLQVNADHFRQVLAEINLEIARTRHNMSQLTDDHRAGRMTTADYTRAMNSERDDLRNLERARDDLTEANNKNKQSLDSLHEVERQNAQDSRDTNAAIQEQKRSVDELVSSYNALASVLDDIAKISKTAADFAGGVGNAFSGMSSLFKTDIAKYATASLTHLATQAITGDLSKAITRYDILNTFVPYMSIAGVDEAAARRAQSRINESILGLPMGLDEATQRLRRYQMYIGDLERATNLTIGVQNAIMAGGSGQAYQTQAYSMIERLLATGDLTNIRQWQSLLTGMGVSAKIIAEELGLNSQQELLAGLRDNTIAAEDFLDALVRLGEGSSAAAGKLQSALDIYKGTLQAWIENIKFAVTRGTANVMQAFNDMLEATTGKGLTGYMSDVRGGINSAYAFVSGYITNNPERFMAIFDGVERLFDAIGRFSATDLFNNVLENVAKLLGWIVDAIDTIEPGKLEEFVSFAVTIAGPLGALFKLMQSGFPIMMGVFERFKDFDFGMLIRDILDAAQALAKTISTILNILPDGLMSKIIAFGLVWGNPLAKTLTTVANAVRGFASALTGAANAQSGWQALSKGGLLSGILYKLGFGAGTGAAVAGATGAGVVATTAAAAAGVAALGLLMGAVAKVQEQMRAQKISDFLHTEEFADFNKEAVLTLDNMQQASRRRSQSMVDTTTNMNKARMLADEILRLDANRQDEWGTDGIIRMRQAVAELNAILPELRLEIDPTTASLTAMSRDALLASDSFEVLIGQTSKRQRKQYLDEERADFETLSQMRTEAAQKEYEARWRYEQVLAEHQAILQRRGGRSDVYMSLDDPLFLTGRALEEAKKTWETAKNELGEYDAELEDKAQNIVRIAASLYSNFDVSKGIDGLDALEMAALNYAQALTDASKAYYDMLEAAQESIEGQVSAFNKLEVTPAKTLDGLTENYADQSRKMERYADVLSRLNKIAEENPEEASPVLQQLMREGVVSDISNLEYLELLAQHWDEHGSWNDLGLWFDNLSENMDKAASALAKFTAILSEDLFTYEEATPIVEGIFGEDSETALATLETFFSDTDYITREQLDHIIESIREKLPEAKNAANELGLSAAEGVEDAKKDVDKAVGHIGAAFQGIVEAAQKNRENGYKAAIAIAQGIGDARETVMATVQGIVFDVAKAFMGLSGINIPTPTVTVTSGVVTNPNKTKFRQRGGMIYASNGQFIPFGTDTVPAMLTPGEFVVKREAVDRFGKAFMDRVNALDIDGAFARLTRANGRLPRFTGVTNYYNNQRDNHATVNQKIITNNPNYTYRRAGRFVRAMA